MERLVGCGPEGVLAGILTEPDSSSSSRVGLVLLSPGLLHRVGNSRFNVLLARRLARAGVPSLRFDFSGNGDSPRRVGVPRTYQSAIEEVRWAVAELRRATGVAEVMLVGHCSGADVAQRAAVYEQAVTGLILTDPIVYPTPKFLAGRYLPRILDIGALMRVPQTLASMYRGVPPANPDWARQVPDRPVIESELRALAGRGVRVLAVFTGGPSDTYGYEGQYREAFHTVPFNDLLVEHFVPSADHVLSRHDDRQMIVRWAEQFVVGAPAVGVMRRSGASASG